MTKTTKVLGALLLLLAGSASAQIQTVIVTGSVDKPSGSSADALDPCRRCEIIVEYVGTNDLTANSTVVTDTPSTFVTDDSGDWTTSPLELLEGGNYRFRFRDPSWPQAGIFLDVTKTAADDDADGTVAFSVLTTVNVAEGADVSALDHGSLSGLGDDDHTQYAKKAGEAGYSGTHDFSGATVSGIAYGDLSGTPATFAPSSHSIASHSDTTATGAELETLTDGSDADSLHTHGGLDDWSDSGTVVSVQTGRDVAIGASVSVDNSTGTVDALAYTVGGTALASTDLSDGATVTNLGDTIEAAEISDLAAGTDITADLEEETHASEHGEAGGDPIPLGTFELSDLGDVSVASPSSGQALAWGGSAWEPTTITGSVSAADDLSDVAVTTPSGGQVLVHDGVGDFKNVTVSGDATLATNGAISLASGSVDTAELAAGAVTNTEIAAAAGISLSKIEDSGTAGLFLQSGGGGGDPAYGTIVTGDLPSGATLDTEWDTIAELEAATGANIFTTADGALADDDLSDDSINALSDVDTVTSAPTSGQVLSWDGVSAWTPGTDDDVPESGDFGAAADLEADGSLSADVVGAAELADRDWGDVTSAAGVISIDTGAVGTDEIATDGVGSAEIAANAVGASELADDAVDLAALSDADYGDWSVALGAATLDANTVGPSELEATAVTPGSYTFTALTVDADGRITAASSGTDDDSPDSDAEVPDAITVGVGGTVAAAATVSVEAAEISDANAGTDITADLEEETHASEHQNGGADEISVAGLSGQLADAQPIAVHKDGAAATGTRPALNFQDTSPITVALADDAGNGWVDVTIACPTCSTDSYALSVQEGDVELTGSATALDFGAGFDLTETPTGEANIVLDYTEDPVNLSGSEVTGTLPAASVGNGLTDAQVLDTLTIGSGGSVAAGALPSTVVYEDGTHTMSGSFNFSTGTITVAGDEWVDADVSNAITVDNYLPLAGGAMTGNVTASAGVTFDGVDLSALNFTDLAGTATDAQIPDTITIDGSANVSNASLNAEVMRTDTTETVASIHTYTAAPNMNTTGVPFTMGVGVTGTVTRLDADLLDGEHASAFADASHAHAGEDITSGTVADARIASTLTRDTEWDTAAEINAATTDDDFVTETGTHTVSGTYTLTGSVDGGGGTVEIPNSTSLPATCAVGDIYMDTDATSGQRLYLCESTNAWAVQGDGDGGSTTLDIAYDNEGATGNRVVNMDDGNVKFDMDDATNDYHLVVDNTTTGTMDRGVQVGISGAGGVITDAIDVSAAGIVNAIDIGANNIATDAATISSDELEILDNGIDPADLDDGDYGDFTIASGVASLDANVVAQAEMADDAIGPAEMADGDFGDFTVATNVASLDADVVTIDEMGDSDHGDFTYASGVASLDADVVAPAEMADADHGDISWSGGVASLDAGVVGASEVAADALDFDDFVDAMTLDADTDTQVDTNREWSVTAYDSATQEVQLIVGDYQGVSQWDPYVEVRKNGSTGIGISTSPMLGLTVDAGSNSTAAIGFYTETGATIGPLLDATRGGGTASLFLSADSAEVTDFAEFDGTTLSWSELGALDGGVGASELTDGDFGDFTVSSGVATLDSGVVDAAEIADTVDFGGLIGGGTLQTFSWDEGDILWDSNTSSGSGFIIDHAASNDPNLFSVRQSDEDPYYVRVNASSLQTRLSGGSSTEVNRFTIDWDPSGNTPSFELRDTAATLNGSSDAQLLVISDVVGVTHVADSSLIKLSAASSGSNGIDASDADLSHALDIGANSVGTDSGDVTAAQLAILSGRTASGLDSEIVTGTAGTSGNCAEWNADGDLVDAGAACGSGGSGFDTITTGTNTTATMTVGTGGSLTTSGSGTITATTAAALAANPADCGAGQWAAGIDADGTAAGCTTDDDVPESGDFGAATDLEADGSLSVDVVAPAEMADADHGDISWSAGVASIDSGVVGPTELASTAVTPGSYTSADITVDADGRITAASNGSGGSGFDAITTGTNTTATMTVGTGASIVASGSGSITATDVSCSTCVDLTSEVTGTLPDANVANDLTIAGGTIGTSAITLVQGTAPTPTAEGVVEWDSDDDRIVVGDSVDQVVFVPTEDVGGDATMSTAGALSLANDVVAPAEMADADHGDVSWSGGVASLDNDVVAAAEMADADHGDISWSAGVASVDADAVALSTDTTGNYVATVADAGSSRVTVSGSGSEGAAVTLDVNQANLDHGSIGGLTDDDHALYLNTSADDTFSATDWVVAADTSDGSDSKSVTLASGGAASTSRGAFLDLEANENSGGGGFLLSSGIHSSAFIESSIQVHGHDATTRGTLTLSSVESDGGNAMLVGLGDPGIRLYDSDENTKLTLDGSSFAFTTSGSATATFGSNIDVLAADVVGVGATTAASSACIANDGSDRIFHDSDCDETKDAGEEYIDYATRQHEEWIAAGDARCYHQSSGGATADASDQAASSAHAWGAGYIFPDGSDTTITCRVRLPASFDASSAVEIQLDGHAEGAVAGAADVDFEVSIKEVGDGESWASAFGSAQGTTAGELDINVGNFATDVSERTSWFTLTETLAAGDWLVLEIMRDGDDATNDDKASDFRLDDIGIRWTETLE